MNVDSKFGDDQAYHDIRKNQFKQTDRSCTTLIIFLCAFNVLLKAAYMV